MDDLEKVLDAFRISITVPKCRECPWESCETHLNKRIAIPADLALAVMSLLTKKYSTSEMVQELASRDGVEKTYIEPGQEYEAPIIDGPATVLVIQG